MDLIPGSDSSCVMCHNNHDGRCPKIVQQNATWDGLIASLFIVLVFLGIVFLK